MKYEFIKIDLDTYKLVYTNKDKKEVSIEFKRTNEMAKNLQGITAKARIKMFQQLSSMGLTKDDLIIKREDGKGHTTYDETNYQEFEKGFIEEESIMVTNDIIEKCFKINIKELFEDMGLNFEKAESQDIKQVEMFTQKFATIIKGEEDNSPSGENKE
jgi:hypothetical protein